jgi:hypothetical protein
VGAVPSAATQQTPIATLLSHALVAFTIEFDNLAEERMTAAGARPWMVSQAMWANHLRFVGDGGIAKRELMHRSLVSASTMRSRLGAFRRRRYVTVDAGGIVRLTDAGQRSSDVWRPLAAEVEARWGVRHGRSAIDALRAALVPSAAADMPLPHHLPIVGGGMFSEVVSPPEPLPDEPDGLDVSALLARAQLVLILAFESEAKLSLPVHTSTACRCWTRRASACATCRASRAAPGRGWR